MVVAKESDVTERMIHAGGEQIQGNETRNFSDRGLRIGEKKGGGVITKNAPYAWGNFHACAITRFQKPQQLSWAGRGLRARRSTRAQLRSEPTPNLMISSQCCCKLRLKLLLVDQLARKT